MRESIINNETISAKSMKDNSPSKVDDLGPKQRILLVTDAPSPVIDGLLSADFDIQRVITGQELITLSDTLIFPRIVMCCFVESCFAETGDRIANVFDALIAARAENHFQLICVANPKLWDELETEPDTSADFLIAPDDYSEMARALVIAKANSRSLVMEDDRRELLELRRLSADVERIARQLSQLTDANGQRAPDRPIFPAMQHGKFADPGSDYKVQPPLKMLASDESETLTNSVDHLPADEIRQIIKARRLRDEYFDSELFADPAWDMLLDLLAARLEGQRVSVSSLCIAAHVPPTTALRWIRTMTDHGIFQRQADAEDGRRVWIELNEEAAGRLVGYFARLKQLGVNPV